MFITSTLRQSFFPYGSIFSPQWYKKCQNKKVMFFKSKSDSDETGFINNQSVILQHHMYTHPINKILDHCYAILCEINFWMKLYPVQLAWFILNAYKELTHVVCIELNFSLVTSLCYGQFCWSQENQTSKLTTPLN